MGHDVPLVTIEEIREARVALDGIALRTPLEDSRHVSKLVGGQVLLKCEHLQRTGSFKIRGAYTRISRLSDAEKRAGVVAASAGNHAQGVALAAQLLGVDSTVFMPSNAPLPKVAATRAYGAEVRFIDGAVDDCLTAAQEFADEVGRVLVHPFDHRDIIAGQGTLGLELAEQAPQLKTVLVPVGGGGLISGVAVAMRAALPDLRIIGVQAAGAASIAPSLAAGRPLRLDEVDTIADGIAVKRPGDLTLPHIRDLVDEVVLVDDATTSRAVLLLLERAKQLVEPSGAIALGALIAKAVEIETPAAVMLTGGNIDPLVLRTMISIGLTEERRYVALRARIPDSPGSLATLLNRLAAARSNVVTVEHHRLRDWIGLGMVEVVVELEARGPEHVLDVIAQMRGHGYDVEEA
jgi:threonine dehydratase